MLKNERGFTLIEMLIVLMIISLLLLITIPNITKNNNVVESKSCEAYIQMVETQVQTYKMDQGQLPTTIDDLVDQQYLDQATCPSGEGLQIDEDGNVTIVATP
ncbi:competence type IV pilus major pilin ComGC [Pontibacillus litoralis]|uniref:ComG operon protein 3 n=1 Tax=Pontibacillus litoralis JSM 072002 TaxID=1385512 RepID=A0A0A5G9Y7_9BACI|nr:competence type IV pilus major pilin ComGC [Pontibacillus litoralis]KGX88869.1 competence protein ComG [Pontibacillus litoralis JSM 072002]